jgi:tRNA acetyltransferase TAN1
MIDNFNLLATTDQITESEASSELWMQLRAIGDDEPIVDRLWIKGLIHARTSLDPTEAIKLLRTEMEKYPDSFKNIYRILPIQRLVSTRIEEIAETTQTLAENIPEDDSFRITLEKRRTDLHSREVIERVAQDIDRSVDLEEPDWILLVEIMGDITGISVIKPNEMLNIQKEKYALSRRGD